MNYQNYVFLVSIIVLLQVIVVHVVFAFIATFNGVFPSIIEFAIIVLLK